MGRFGLGKKDDGDEESSRSKLFGGRSKTKSPNPQTTNPYANLPTQADAYNAAKAKAGVPGYAQRGPSPAPPPPSGSYGRANGGYPNDMKSGGYGGTNGGPPEEKKSAGYGAEKYGAQSGYGADRYGSGSSSLQPDAGASSSRYGPGGYGGLGRAPSSSMTDADDNRDALFGGAKERVQKRTDQQMGYGQPPPYEEGQPGGYGESGPSYEAYGDRQLTAEEEEEEDVTATKQQIRFIKQVGRRLSFSDSISRSGLVLISPIGRCVKYQERIAYRSTSRRDRHEHAGKDRSTRRPHT